MLSRVFGFGRRPFESLSEQEILALAISSEEDDGRIYRAYAEGLAESFPQSAKVFEAMALEEDGHRDSLIELYRKRFGERIPLIRREHVKGYFERKPDWLVKPLGIEHVRRQAIGIGAVDAPVILLGRNRQRQDLLLRKRIEGTAAEAENSGKHDGITLV